MRRTLYGPNGVFDAQPHLVGDNVELRPLARDDYAALRAAAADPSIWEQHPLDRHEEDVFRAYFEDQLASGGALLILERATGEAIGSSRYHAYDSSARQVEIGWTFLVRRHWGGVTNGEVKRLMLEHAFGFVDSVVFRAHPGNRRSQRAIEKLGAVRIEDGIDGYGDLSCAYRLRRPAP
jgi:RimJ/RimL family protein N-acetyltransferase